MIKITLTNDEVFTAVEEYLSKKIVGCQKVANVEFDDGEDYWTVSFGEEVIPAATPKAA